MIVVELNGGLGNQLFQYAFGRRLANDHQTTLWLDLNWLRQHHRPFALDAFAIQAQLAPEWVSTMYGTRSTAAKRWLQRHFNRNQPLQYINESHPFHYDHTAVQRANSCYVSGYWQHTAYFETIEQQLREELTFKASPAYSDPELSHTLHSSSSVCIHVRRGDYAGNRAYDILPSNYYQQAVNQLEQLTTDLSYYVFSDDITWCQAHFSINRPARFIPEASAFTHLYLMSLCQHFIIPNSTFSWWASWLSQRPGKRIVAPIYWRRVNWTFQSAPGLTQACISI